MRSLGSISSKFSPFSWFKDRKENTPPSDDSGVPHTRDITPEDTQFPHTNGTNGHGTNGHGVYTPTAPVEVRPPRRRRRNRRQNKAAQSSQNGASAQSLQTTVQEQPKYVASVSNLFGDIEVRREVALSLKDIRYEAPTPVQIQVIPLMFAGHDVVGQAQTGTGKTAAFGIPLAQMLSPQDREVQAIILVPTRELCMQVTKELQRLCKHRGLRVVPVYGGQAISTQLALLERGAHIVVGTPGRVMDHMERQTLSLHQVKVAILDEADEMLDIGFAQDMERILRITPRDRQTALFSATMPPFIQRMVRKYMNDPKWVHIDPEQVTVPEIKQVYYEVAERDKLNGLEYILGDKDEVARTLVFCRMQVGVDRLTVRLRRLGYDVEGIHGGLTQPQRTRTMTAFKEGRLKVLIATNVAARGLDIPEVAHVVNYDAPQNLDEYIHRIGRTGRMGRAGLASTFVGEWDFDVLEQIKRAMGEVLEQKRLPIY